MQPLEFEYDGKALIIIRSHADLHIQGWEKNQVLVLPSDLHTARVEQYVGCVRFWTHRLIGAARSSSW